MLISELFEAQPWEKFKGRMSSRVWFNAHTGQAITTNDDGNHSIGITNNKEIFGVSDEILSQYGMKSGESAYDYDGRVLYPAMKNGWVRLFVDPKSPDTGSNAEGISLPFLRRAFVWYCEQIGTPMRFVLVVRNGAGDKEGTPYVLGDAEQINFFIRHGSFRRDLVGQNQDTQVRQINNTPHSFRNIST